MGQEPVLRALLDRRLVLRDGETSDEFFASDGYKGTLGVDFLIAIAGAILLTGQRGTALLNTRNEITQICYHARMRLALILSLSILI